MKKRRILILFHIAVWVFAIFVAWFFSSDEFPGMQSSYVVLSTLALSIWMLGSFYLLYSYLMPWILSGGNNLRFWLLAVIFILMVMPVAGIALLLLTKTSALSLSELLSPEGVLPYLGSVTVTLACSGMGALSRLLLKRYHTE
ncbi:MAG: hypothetical protein IH594_14420 [Bacteroidales bacterium]|nr:hypothetical protein [Bacteroidales bacterium]